MRHFHINTPLGTMVAISDTTALYLLEFVDRKRVDRQLYCPPLNCTTLDTERQRKIEACGPNEEDHSRVGKADEEGRFYKVAACPRLYNSTEGSIRHFPRDLAEGDTALTPLIQETLTHYFLGKPLELPFFLRPFGTTFQHRVWAALQKIPYGKTQSYAEIARAIQHPKATRAVAQAIGANPLALVIPCHRVIRTDHTLGGYSGGLTRKQGLLQHEKTVFWK